ncbi:alpha/beta hydrolase [Leifsonia kafniensis]|uniref:Alpha/beta hydrolase n=1 Tax=Leifsonia kafniensis TaxID=475957 RepID=A0ABP7KGS2_9MICO
MTDSYTFVLIHGAWHDGDLWEPIAGRLRKAGHTVHTPTVAGHGKNAPKDVTHAEGVSSIVDYIVENDVTDFLLLGHSFGGTIISKVAEQVPERIRRLVFWNAFVLENGNSINDESPALYRELMNATQVDGTFMLPFPLWREAFIQDATEELARSSYDQLSAEPMSMLETKLDLTRFYELIGAGALKVSYLNATGDTAMPHGEFAWHPRFSSRLGLHRLVQMEGSHETMFSNPELATTKIIEACRD